MNGFLTFTKKLLKDESGATAIEYGLLAALISIVIIGAVGAIGIQLTAKFDKVNTELGGTTTITSTGG